jgi:hypothetical protein
MATVGQIRRFRRWVYYIAFSLLFVFFALLIFADLFIEPILRARLHTFIIKGSDSLYTYKLEKLKTNFFNGNVEVKNLQISIDSSRYFYLKEKGRLPTLTMQLDLKEGSISGISLIALVFSKKIKLEEVRSKEADIKLSRHVQVKDSVERDLPLWKSIQPDIESIAIKRIKLDGVKLLYKNADTSESLKLQFDECHALFEDIRIDSASAFDTARVGFTKEVSLKFHDLKYRTQDSTYKMKAEWITYSSKTRMMEVDSFKLQPTLEKEDFYKWDSTQRTMYVVEFQKARFVNTRLDRFINNDIISADSVVFQIPNIQIRLDRSMRPLFESKVGQYPHQKLMKASSTIDIRTIVAQGAKVEYSEKNPKTGLEGRINFDDLDLLIKNATNNKKIIAKNPECSMHAAGKILGTSPMSIDFKFPLDSFEGRYNARGFIKNVSTAQISPLARALANVQINSFNIHSIEFDIYGKDFEATGALKMRYDNLSITLKKIDEETGVNETKKFLTKFLTKFVLWPSNPGPDGVERTTSEARALRLSTQSFFGLLWKTVFDGMQDVMMKSGRYQ